MDSPAVKKVRRKGNPISISDKLKIIAKLETGLKGTEVAAEFGIAKQTVSDIKKSKQRIREYAARFEISADGDASERITLKPANDVRLDEAVYRWYVTRRAAGGNIRGVDLQLAAELEAETMGVAGFVASSGWLWRFRKRHGIVTQDTWRLRNKHGSSGRSGKKNKRPFFVDESYQLEHMLADSSFYESKPVAGNSSFGGYPDPASADNTHCDDVSVDLSPDQILGDDGDVSRTSVSPPASRPESFKLSHNNHLSIVLDSLAGDESFMDVTLTAQGKSIKAHKSVLSAVSPYFKGVLRANPCQHPIIIMPRDITFDQLRNIIAYVYKGEMTVAASELSNLLKTAELLQVSGLSPSETGSNSFSEEPRSPPQQPTASKWMDDSSPSQRTVKTPVKTAKPASKKRHRSHSREYSPAPKRTSEFQDNSSEITCVKEELNSGNEFEEMDYPPAAAGIDDPGENSANFSMASEASNNSDERNDPLDPLISPKTESPHETVFECAFCDKSFGAKEDQEAHIKASHPSKQICVCSCGKSFETPVDLEDHKQTCLMI